MIMNLALYTVGKPFVFIVQNNPTASSVLQYLLAAYLLQTFTWSLLALYFVHTFSPYCLLRELRNEASELLQLTVEAQKDEGLVLIAAE